MSTRPPDFKASGIRTERLIASGSLQNPRLLIIGSGSTHSDGITVDTSTLRLTGTGSDTWLFISGSIGGNDRVTFGGDVWVSGTLWGASPGGAAGSDKNVQYNSGGAFAGSNNLNFDGSVLSLTGSLGIRGGILPGSDMSYSLGSPTRRWANVYTGDLHLRNDRGDWTVIEEEEFLTVTNNRTGKRFRILMEPLPE